MPLKFCGAIQVVSVLDHRPISVQYCDWMSGNETTGKIMISRRVLELKIAIHQTIPRWCELSWQCPTNRTQNSEKVSSRTTYLYPLGLFLTSYSGSSTEEPGYEATCFSFDVHAYFVPNIYSITDTPGTREELCSKQSKYTLRGTGTYERFWLARCL